MSRTSALLAAALSCCAFSGLSAQTLAPAPVAQPAPALLPVAAPNQAVLRAQTPIILRMSEELTTKKKAVRVGQRFNLEVAEPIVVEGATVVPVGAPATGEITEVRNKGMWGKSGYIGARLVHVRVGDRTIRLSGQFDDKGVTGTGGVVAAIAFLPVAGFFTTGTSAAIPAGAGVKGFIDEDVPLAMNVAPVTPMTVAAPTAPMTVAVPAAAAAPAAVQPAVVTTPAK